MKAKDRFQALIVILTVAVMLGVRGWMFNTGAVGADASGQAAPLAQVPSGFGGEYSGRIDITDVVTGQYTDALATVTPVPSPTRPPGTLTPAPPAPRHGGKVEFELDLVLNLRTTGCQPPATVCGHVTLDRTLGFHTLAYPQVAVIQATPMGPTPLPGQPAPVAQPLPIGPRVSGTFDGTTLRLESEVFSLVQAAARTIPTPPVGPQSASFRSPEQKVERQFRLVGTVQNGGTIFVGEYRETMTRIVDGLRGQPATALGQFSISRPVFGGTPVASPPPGASATPTATPRPGGGFRIFLPLVERKVIRP